MDPNCQYTLDVSNGGTQQTYTVAASGQTFTAPQWTQKTYTFTATGTSSDITFTSITNVGGNDGW